MVAKLQSYEIQKHLALAELKLDTPQKQHGKGNKLEIRAVMRLTCIREAAG